MYYTSHIFKFEKSLGTVYTYILLTRICTAFVSVNCSLLTTKLSKYKVSGTKVQCTSGCFNALIDCFLVFWIVYECIGVTSWTPYFFHFLLLAFVTIASYIDISHPVDILLLFNHFCPVQKILTTL